MEIIEPDWQAAPRVRAFVTTRAFGDTVGEGKRKLRALLPAEPSWLKQVHGTRVLDLDVEHAPADADAAVTRAPRTVCAVRAADCMPVFLTDATGSAVAVAHAGWRGLCGGVIEATWRAMHINPESTLAWLGPAIGPRAYEVGVEVRAAFIERDAAAAAAFIATRPGHWLLDLYAVARQRLEQLGVRRIHGGGFCTYTDAARFFSYRREGSTGRMAALIWLT